MWSLAELLDVINAFCTVWQTKFSCNCIGYLRMDHMLIRDYPLACYDLAFNVEDFLARPSLGVETRPIVRSFYDIHGQHQTLRDRLDEKKSSDVWRNTYDTRCNFTFAGLCTSYAHVSERLTEELKEGTTILGARGFSLDSLTFHHPVMRLLWEAIGGHWFARGLREVWLLFDTQTQATEILRLIQAGRCTDVKMGLVR